MFDYNEFDPKSYPRFESVYDNVPDFGRSKSPSYRIYKGAKAANLWNKVQVKADKRKLRAAVKALRQIVSEQIALANEIVSEIIAEENAGK